MHVPARPTAIRSLAVLATGGAVWLSILAPGATPAAAASSCSAVEVDGARGTGEPAGMGSLIGPVAAKISTALSGTSVTTWADPYPASADYLNSVQTGVTDLTSHLTQQAAACPSQRFVLGGYSQGAEVIVKTLIAGLPASVSGRIAAVVLFGDPEFVAGQPYDVGSYAAGVNGLSPRFGSVDAYKTVIRDDCNGDDMICQSGKGSIAGHLTYLTDTADQNAAAAFVKAKVNGSAVPVPVTPVTAAPPVTTVPMPTASAGAGSTSAGFMPSFFTGLVSLLTSFFTMLFG